MRPPSTTDAELDAIAAAAARERELAPRSTFKTPDGLELELHLEPHDKPLLEWARITFPDLRRIKPAAVKCAACVRIGFNGAGAAKAETPATWWLQTIDTRTGLCDEHLAVLASAASRSSRAMSSSIKQRKGR
jgi:hypothetical protein